MTTKEDWSNLVDELAATSMQAKEILSELRSELGEARRVTRELKTEVDKIMKLAINDRIDADVKKGLDEYKETISKAMEAAVARVDKTFNELANTYLTGHKRGHSESDLRKLIEYQ